MNLSSNGPGLGLSVTPSELYLDAAATTPPLPSVIASINAVQREAWGNPSSLHGTGLVADEQLARSRQTIAAQLSADEDELIFTSGATESVHLALHGVAAGCPPGRLVISAVEHPAVEGAAAQLAQLGWTVARWPVDGSGQIRLELLDQLLAPPTQLVSLIWGQSEVGTVQPVPLVASACRERGIPFHTDATQLIPQGLMDWSTSCIDLLSFSSHKLQGPRGIGVLLHRSGVLAQPLLTGGGQEGGYRAGTEAVALIAGLAVALQQLPQFNPQQSMAPPGSTPQIRSMRDRLQSKLAAIPSLTVINATEEPRLPHHLACLIGDRAGHPLPGRRLVQQLSRLGVACSSGSACRSGHAQDSAVLTAMDVAPSWRQSLLRFSLGPWLSDDDVDAVPPLLIRAIDACT